MQRPRRGHRRRPTTIVIAVTLGLSGCVDLPRAAPNPVVTAARACLAQNKLFLDAWGCVQGRAALEQGEGDDAERARVLKLGDDLASQVAAKALGNAEALKRLAEALPADG